MQFINNVLFRLTFKLDIQVRYQNIWIRRLIDINNQYYCLLQY